MPAGAAAIAAGKHVVCEKPLGVDTAETADLVARAADAGVVNAVCFNLRHYPHNQHAAALVSAGAIGEPRLISGHYLQDWLLLDTDWNWRLDAARQGNLRAVADIGSHWLDLVQLRQRPARSSRCSPTCTRSSASGAARPARSRRSPPPVSATTSPRVREQMESDDAAGLLLRFDGGARGVCTISQVSAGRRNRLAWEIDGDRRRRWRGRPTTPTTCGSATAADPTRSSRRIRRC